MMAWVEGTHEAVIAPHFTVASIVDFFQQYAIQHKGDALEDDIKPTVDALRAELVEQIKRIDSFVYVPVGPAT